MRLLILLLALFVPALAQAQNCPAPLAAADRLVLVTPENFASSSAPLRVFTRGGPRAPWQAQAGPVTTLIGHKGTGWAEAFRAFARPGEPVKRDGDKRAPAGVYRIGPAFGFAPSRRPGYLKIEQGTVCVDDPRHPAYNRITTRAAVGWRVHGENMWRVREYVRGLLVDYPTDARDRAGSCIFIHTRLPGATGTSGCVSLPEPEVAKLQDFAQSGAVLAIVPQPALARFKDCLP